MSEHAGSGQALPDTYVALAQEIFDLIQQASHYGQFKTVRTKL